MAPHSDVEGHHLEYVLTCEDYVAFNVHAATTLAETRRQLFQYRVGGALGLALLVVILDVTTRGDGLAWALVLAAIPAALWWGLSPQLMQRSMRRTLARIADTSGLGHVGPTSQRLDARGVHEECGGVATSAEWAEILRVDETAEHGFIFIGPMAAFIVPKTIGIQADAFLSTLRARLSSEQERPAR